MGKPPKIFVAKKKQIHFYDGQMFSWCATLFLLTP